MGPARIPPSLRPCPLQKPDFELPKKGFLFRARVEHFLSKPSPKNSKVTTGEVCSILPVPYLPPPAAAAPVTCPRKAGAPTSVFRELSRQEEIGKILQWSCGASVMAHKHETEPVGLQYDTSSMPLGSPEENPGFLHALLV